MTGNDDRMDAAPPPPLGVSGRIARFFLTSQLTLLIALVLLFAGVFAIIVTPREEEPQIDVTMANVIVPFAAGTATGLALGESNEAAIFLGAALAATSVGITSALLA